MFKVLKYELNVADYPELQLHQCCEGALTIPEQEDHKHPLPATIPERHHGHWPGSSLKCDNQKYFIH